MIPVPSLLCLCKPMCCSTFVWFQFETDCEIVNRVRRSAGRPLDSVWKPEGSTLPCWKGPEFEAWWAFRGQPKSVAGPSGRGYVRALTPTLKVYRRVRLAVVRVCGGGGFRALLYPKPLGRFLNFVRRSIVPEGYRRELSCYVTQFPNFCFSFTLRGTELQKTELESFASFIWVFFPPPLWQILSYRYAIWYADGTVKCFKHKIRFVKNKK